MKHKINIVLAHLLSVALLVSCFGALMPAFDAGWGSAAYATSQASVSDIRAGDRIYMGRSDADGFTGVPCWRVLDKDQDGSLMLLSEYLWLGDGSDPDTMIQFNPQAFHYEWAESNAKKWCQKFEQTVLGDVDGLEILPTTKSDAEFASPDFENIKYQGRDNILDGDKVFFLSAEEAFTYMPAVSDRVAYLHDGVHKGEAESWWLRSPRWLSELSSVTCAGRVFSEGTIGKNEVYQFSAMRPAMRVKLAPDTVVSVCSHNGSSVWVIGKADAQPEYGKAVYKWSADYSTCTAEATCKTCGTVVTETVNTSLTTVEPTTESSGMATYTAEFTHSCFSTAVKKLYLPPKEPEPAKPAAVKVKTDLPALKILKPNAGKKKVTVKWGKVSKKNQKKIKGIEIQVATDSKFKHIVKKTTAGKAKTSATIKGLKSKKKYWIRIRTYKKTGNVKHVSKWKVKTVKVK